MRAVGYKTRLPITDPQSLLDIEVGRRRSDARAHWRLQPEARTHSLVESGRVRGKLILESF